MDQGPLGGQLVSAETRIERRFADLARAGRAGLVTFVTAGDPDAETSAAILDGLPGVLHGNRTYLLQDEDGQVLEAHSISAGLDYPGIGPEHAWLNDAKRVSYVPITDDEALDAFKLCARLEGILPALEPAHALAHVVKLAPTLPKDHIIVMNMCGRGDKDVFTVAKALGVEL